MQMLECLVALAGDTQNIVHRGADNPVTYPELLVLGYLHGEDAVTDAYQLDGDAGDKDVDNNSEWERLKRTYGLKAVADVFPGARPKLPTSDPRIKVRTGPAKPKREPVNLDPVTTSDPLPIEVTAGGVADTGGAPQVAGVAQNAIDAAKAEGRPIPAAPVPIVKPIEQDGGDEKIATKTNP